jgi:hypothetical protein
VTWQYGFDRGKTSKGRVDPGSPHSTFYKGEIAMQYMLMCYMDSKLWGNLPDSQINEIMQEYDGLMESLVKSGKCSASMRLQSTSTSKTVRAKNGRPASIDGPFAETREQLGGFHIVDCKDLDEAVSIAGRIPTIKVGGTIEVRPVMPKP